MSGGSVTHSNRKVMADHKLNQLLRALPPVWWKRIKQGIRIQFTEAEQSFLELLEQHPEWDDQQLRSALQQQGIQTDLRALRHRVYTKVLQIGAYALMQRDEQSTILFDLVLSRFAFEWGQDSDALRTVAKTYRSADIAGDPIQKLAAMVLQLEYHLHRNFQLLDHEALRKSFEHLQTALDQTQRYVRLLLLNVQWYSRYFEGEIRIPSSEYTTIAPMVIEQLQKIPAYEADPFPIPFLRWNTEALLWNIQGQPNKAVECYEQLLRYFRRDEDRKQLYLQAYFSALHNQVIAATAARNAAIVEQCFAEITQLQQQSQDTTKDAINMLYLNVALYLTLELGMFRNIFDDRSYVEQVLQQYRRQYPYFYKVALYHLGCIAFWLQEYELARQYLEAAYDHTSQRLLQQIGFTVRLLLCIIAWEQQDLEALERLLERLRRFVRQYPAFVPVVRTVRRIVERMPNTFAERELMEAQPFYRQIHRMLSDILEREAIEFDLITWLEAKAKGISITEYYQQKRQQQWEESSGRMPALKFLQWHELVPQ